MTIDHHQDKALNHDIHDIDAPKEKKKQSTTTTPLQRTKSSALRRLSRASTLFRPKINIITESKIIVEDDPSQHKEEPTLDDSKNENLPSPQRRGSISSNSSTGSNASGSLLSRLSKSTAPMRARLSAMSMTTSKQPQRRSISMYRRSHGERSLSFSFDNSHIHRPFAEQKFSQQQPHTSSTLLVASPIQSSLPSSLPSTSSPSEVVTADVYATTMNERKPIVYPALLSKVSEAFRERVTVNTKTKDNIEYSNAFDGREAVDKLAYIIKTTDRNLALLLGRALDAQKFFHDVNYEHRLRDSRHELYQFNSDNNTIHYSPDASTLHDDVDNITEDRSSVNLINEENTNKKEHNGIPNGVFTVLTDCYSPTCIRGKPCYSASCPRRMEQVHASSRRPAHQQHSRSSSKSSLFAEEEDRLWIYTVPKSLVESMNKQEIRRQENIHELIYTEKDFVNDLLYLKKYWINPLLDEPIISEDQNDRDEFVDQVFWNIIEIYKINTALSQALQKRQAMGPDVYQIGDVMMNFAAKFEPFVRYGAHQVIGKHIFETEKSTNAEFAKFIQKTERLKISRKLELNGYLTKPTTRLGRYNLILREVLRHTPEDHPDQENISKAMKIIANFLTIVNRETGKTESRHNLYLLEQRLINHRQADMLDLGLRAENRQLVLKGALKKKGTGSESSDILLFLLDHYLVITKQKFISNNEYYKLYRKPIPLALLSISFPDLAKRSSSILPYSRTSKDSFTSIGSMDSVTIAISPPPPSPSASTSTNSNYNNKSGYPLCFSHLGKHGTAPITLYASTMAIRRQWIVKIQNQQQVLMEKNKVVELVSISDNFFTSFNKVRCAASYDGGKSLVFGSDQGVYVKRKKGFVRILAMEKVSQIDVLEGTGAHRLLLVLADKAFYAYPLDTLLLDPELAGSGKSSNSNRRGNAGRKINSHVSFFKIGKIQRSSAAEKTLVCFVRQNAMTSTIRALEPQQHHLGRLIRGPHDSLRIYKDLYIPGVASSIQFFRNIICVGCPKGFQMVDLGSTEVQSVLDPSDSRHQSILQRENLKPITMFRNDDGNILLCYNEIAFYIDKKGRRVREDWMICWESNPVSFAFKSPYIIAFDPTLIEVRHIDTVSI
ncbi:CNH domain-containing protein [Phascolomyces articulosus]|uniref:CNH domain-containing protein n=1 Tax=Phascolomyces articulosus TaxID=60185 RepID=A0AAD5JYW5_9FUNG|nr:CNH domain-containing protein [Phascolomyces articulosus]